MSDTTHVYQMTKSAPLVWAHLAAPRAARKLPTGVEVAPQYEGSWLFDDDHPDLEPIKKMLAQVATEKFPERVAANKAARRAPFDGITFSLENGTKEADNFKALGKDREFLRGKARLKAKGLVTTSGGKVVFPPTLLVAQNGKYVPYNEAERALAAKFFDQYPGVHAAGQFKFIAWGTGAGAYVTAYINEVISLNAGEKIDTGTDRTAKWGAPSELLHVGVVSSVDPTAGMDDEIPF